MMMKTMKTLLTTLLFVGTIHIASATVVADKTFTAADGFSEGGSITGIDGWTTAGLSPDWVAKDVSGSGYTLNASTVDSRVVCELGQTWSDTSNDAFNLTVDFSVPSTGYSTKTELFSIALYPSSSGATAGFGAGIRVYWDGGRFMMKGRNGGATSAYTELDHTASGIDSATVYLRIEKTSTADQLELTYSFDDFVSYRTATMEYTAIYGDTDGLFFQMCSEDAAKNGGSGIEVHSVKVEKDVEWVDPYERPFIIARMSERPAILEKIANHSWAQSQRDSIVNDADDIVDDHQANREAFIRRLPLELVSGELRFRRDLEENDAGFDPLGEAEKCAVAYYLTQDEKYAKAAADIFHNVAEALSNTTPFTGTTESWMTKHILGESRTKTYRIAVTYDFIHPYLKNNPTVYEWTSTSGLTAVTYGNTQFDDAEYVFEKYVDLIKTRGYAGNNWSANEAQGLVPAALAIDDTAKRANALRYYVDLDTSRQDSIKSDADEYPAPGDIWPESLHYSVEVNNIHPILMAMVDRYDPSINLYGKYPNVIQSVSRPYQLQFPNNTPPSFGDRGSVGLQDPDGVYEIIYAQAQKNGAQWLMDIYGPLINESIANGSHSRNRAGGKFYYANLLWGADEIIEPAEAKVIYRTDTLPHAGMALQRNLSSTGDVNNDLMCYVAGAAYTHSHADGMNIELFGNGYVVGADAAKASYKTDLHENYYRVFAAHNTIIVNGASRGSGGWQGTGINTVQVEAMEPATGEKALSSDISYTCTTFEDNKGSDAEASQQRTLSLIRTSPTTGYYVDIYRSNSSKSGEYHDYLYHNIGELLEINKASDGTALPLSSEPNRFQNDIGDGYKQPGWRYFEEVYNGSSTENIKAIFTTGALSGGNRYMDVHIAGEDDREYAKVMAPPVRHHTQTYQNEDCPTLVVRRTGEAWDRPFAVVYEPHMGAKDSGSVQSVERLISYGTVYGLKVVSDVNGKTITQYVLSNPNPTDTKTHSTYGIEFTGRFAVITDNGDGSGSMYMGDGSSLTYNGYDLEAQSGRIDATLAFFPDRNPVYKSNSPLENCPTITPIADQQTTPNMATAPISFTMGHDQLPVSSLTISAESSNEALVANENIVIGGTGANRTLTITPALNMIGSTEISVWVDDGTKAAQSQFILKVSGPLPTTTLFFADFTDDEGHSDGNAIAGVNGWATQGRIPDWTTFDTTGDGEARSTYAVSDDSRAAVPIGDSWSFARDNEFTLHVDFSVLDTGYTSDTDLFSIGFTEDDASSAGGPLGTRVIWNTGGAGYFSAVGRIGGSTGGQPVQNHTAQGISRATLSLRIAKDPASYGDHLVEYSFDDFATKSSTVLNNTALYNDIDGIFLQLTSEDAALNGGGGIVIHSIEVGAVPAPPLGPLQMIAHWPMDEGTGSSTVDGSGNGHDGLIDGAVWAAGSGNRASYLQFDGSNDRVDPSLAFATLSQSDASTWAFWVKADAGQTEGNGIIVGNRKDGAGNDIGPGTRNFLKFTPRGRYNFHQDSSKDISFTALSADTWTHIALSRDGDQLTVYYNGVAEPTVTINSLAATPTGAMLPFYIGGEPGQSGSEHFAGGIDDVALFATALTQAQVVNVMNGVYGGDPVEPPVLDFGWLGGDLGFAWEGDGFKVQTCTNLLDGIWVDHPGGDTSPVSIPPSEPAAYFRLIEQ